MFDCVAVPRMSIACAPRAARLVAGAMVSVALAVSSMTAAAQGADAYPSHPIKILIPYGPGGATDIIARHLASKLDAAIGQTIVIENRAGASGNIALEAAAKAAPDGYTLLVGNVSTNAINESTFAKVMKVRPSRDLVGITRLVEIPHIIAASNKFPANSVAELIDYAKKNPGKVNYASAGPGTYPHLDMLKLATTAGVSMTHVPYKTGAAGMVTALMSDEVQVSFINLSSTISQIRAGRMKAIADVAPVRVAELPNVPTMTEQGYAGIGTNAWQALFAPAATPRPVIDKLFAAVVSVMTKPEMKATLDRAMMTVSLSKSPQEFNDFVQAETKKWADFVRENNVSIE